MEEVSQVFARHGVGHGVASGRLSASGARVVVYVEVHPHQMVSWRLTRDAELRIGDASVWLTRHRDPYDYWMKPGDVVRLSRGERVWLTSDSDQAIEVSLTSYREARRGMIARWLARVWPRMAQARANAL
jgi:ABC-type Zn2+ transport system substrate-binding protein/surface adhesin